MTGVAETTRLVDSIVRLRRVERIPQAAEDVAPVRHDLESRLGPTLSRARASRILGVSQTALDRWVAAGEIPIVITPRGRREVPRQFVVEMSESIDWLKRQGPERHPLAAALAERRNAAANEVGAVTPPARRAPKPSAPRGHRTAERRSRAYHEVIAKRLDEQLVCEARERVEHLAAEGHLAPGYAEHWRQILSLPIAQIAKAIAADDQEARDLRQNSPFAGVLNEQERRHIIETVR